MVPVELEDLFPRYFVLVIRAVDLLDDAAAVSDELLSVLVHEGEVRRFSAFLLYLVGGAIQLLLFCGDVDRVIRSWK